jgi:hypothetical protein
VANTAAGIAGGTGVMPGGMNLVTSSNSAKDFSLPSLTSYRLRNPNHEAVRSLIVSSPLDLFCYYQLYKLALSCCFWQLQVMWELIMLFLSKVLLLEMWEKKKWWNKRRQTQWLCSSHLP